MSMITELIERLRQHADTFAKSGFAVDGLVKDYREAADTIQLLSEKLHASQMERSSQYYHSGWIPVSERLPEKYGEYLVTWTADGLKRSFLCLAECEVLEYDHEKNRFNVKWTLDEYTEAYKNPMVTAWMPLPEPYKAESEDKE